jgi:clan AA aspartic protease (TIGR02281 family)
MKPRHLLRAAVLLALVSGSAHAADAKDPLKDAGLTRAGDKYVLEDEKAILEGYGKLKTSKADSDKESRARMLMDMQIAAKRKAAVTAEKEYRDLERRIDTVPRDDIKNKMILRMNRLVADHKAAMEQAKDLETQAGKLSTMNKTKFIDDLAALSPKVDEAAKKYTALAADKTVAAAVARALPKATLGPSAEFTEAVTELGKWRTAVETEAIPLREESGTFTAEVLLNNKPFRMRVNSGTSSVLLPFDVAKQIDLTPTDKDEDITLKLPNGTEIQGKEMVIPSVRVGRFSVKDIRCIVLEPNLEDPPLILGGTFLNNFIHKIDPSKNELHLTEIVQGSATAKEPGKR